MSTVYYYIDDEENARTNVVNLNSGDLQVHSFIKEKNWEKQVEFLINKNKENAYSGLLFDWQLQHDDAGISSGYDAEALAQQIRRLATENKIQNDIPIILCSAAPNFEEYINKDETGLDLFDKMFFKGDFNGNNVEIIQREFIALSKGYKEISEGTQNVSELLVLDNLDKLDPRFQAYLEEKLENKVVHEIARVLLYYLIFENGLLIDENTLATRIGVDLEKSSKAHWNCLLEMLESAKYKGVFSNGWNRWWMISITDEWKSWFNQTSLRRTTAAEKITMLKNALDIELVPITKSNNHRSDFFWTNCKYSGMPIDTIDGLLLSGQENKFPWLDKSYVSVTFAVDPANSKTEVKVSPLEKSRLKKLKESFTNAERTRRPRR